jgi:hypothetical protein
VLVIARAISVNAVMRAKVVIAVEVIARAVVLVSLAIIVDPTLVPVLVPDLALVPAPAPVLALVRIVSLEDILIDQAVLAALASPLAGADVVVDTINMNW